VRAISYRDLARQHRAKLLQSVACAVDVVNTLPTWRMPWLRISAMSVVSNTGSAAVASARGISSSTRNRPYALYYAFRTL
ncbi:MAG: hypothetical protein K2X56_25580, partial [Mycobacterium pseudokansasii]|uniref:hypothetical protein n=1 Tax=Mycobacterium pseudokansasii TaxID=2341080 RepID=UPI0023F033F0